MVLLKTKQVYLLETEEKIILFISVAAGRGGGKLLMGAFVALWRRCFRHTIHHSECASSY